MNKTLVLNGTYRPNVRDMIAFRNAGKGPIKAWEAERNTRLVDGTGRVNVGASLRGKYRKEFGPRTVKKVQAAAA